MGSLDLTITTPRFYQFVVDTVNVMVDSKKLNIASKYFTSN